MTLNATPEVDPRLEAFQAVARHLNTVLAGCKVSLTSQRTGTTFSFDVSQAKDRFGKKSELRFVALMENGRSVYVGAIMKDGKFMHTAGSKVERTHPAFLAFDFFWSHLQNAKIAPHLTVTYGQEVTGKSSTQIEIGNVQAIVDLIRGAAKKLKYPKLLISAGDFTLRLSVAGNASKYAGSIMVNDSHAKTSNGWAKLWGRIDPDGNWVRGYQISDADNATVVAALKKFAEDPAGIAAQFGKHTGSCCFCGLTLTDRRSVDVGYGPICAGNWGLPWGN